MSTIYLFPIQRRETTQLTRKTKFILFEILLVARFFTLVLTLGILTGSDMPFLVRPTDRSAIAFLFFRPNQETPATVFSPTPIPSPCPARSPTAPAPSALAPPSPPGPYCARCRGHLYNRPENAKRRAALEAAYDRDLDAFRLPLLPRPPRGGGPGQPVLPRLRP